MNMSIKKETKVILAEKHCVDRNGKIGLLFCWNKYKNRNTAGEKRGGLNGHNFLFPTKNLFGDYCDSARLSCIRRFFLHTRTRLYLSLAFSLSLHSSYRWIKLSQETTQQQYNTAKVSLLEVYRSHIQL